MAKITIDPKAAFESRGESLTVAKALAFIESVKNNDEEGEGMSRPDLAAYAIVYAARRMMALAKDQARVDKGAKPSRIYTPRVAQVKGIKPIVVKHREEARERLAKDLGLIPGKAPKAVKTSKAA